MAESLTKTLLGVQNLGGLTDSSEAVEERNEVNPKRQRPGLVIRNKYFIPIN